MAALAYNEPYKFSAVVLTLAMHAIFFTVLYLGVNWQVQRPQGMEVELWSELPETNIPPMAAAPPAETPPPKPAQLQPKPVEKPAPPAKVEIALPDKKKKTDASKPKQAVKPETKKKPTKAELKRMQEDQQAAEQGADLATNQQLAAKKEKDAQAAQANAAIRSEVDKYKGLISSKIRHNIVMPPDVADNVEAVFVVTLLLSGEVLEAKLLKSSGNSAYDEVVERAIRKSQPLPLPLDEAALKQFINPKQLKLKFSPKDKE